MKNLEKINNVWKDLDTSYKNMKLDNESKKEFFLRIIGAKEDGSDGLDYLESRMTEESDSYTNEEQEIYTNLTSLFRRIKETPEYGMYTQESSLNQIVHSGVLSEGFRNIRDTAGILDEICVMRFVPKQNKIEADLNECYKLTGSLGDSSCIRNGNHYMVHLNDAHAISFTAHNMYIGRIISYSLNPYLQSLVAQYITGYIGAEGDLGLNYIFIDEHYFHIKGDRIYLDIEGCNNYCDISKAEMIEGGYAFIRKINGIEYNIICFLQN